MTRSRARVLRPLLGVALAAFAFAGSTPEVQADGDPASDVLITDTIFLPYDKPSPQVADDLRGVVDEARAAGQPVRVAVINSPTDLGSVSSLFGHPAQYVRLLSRELVSPAEPGSRPTREPLMVVMAAGIASSGLPPAGDRAVRGIELPPGADPDTLASAAGYGIQELMRATGKPIKARFERPKVEGGGGALIPVLVVLGLLLLTGLLVVLRVRTSNANSSASEVAE